MPNPNESKWPGIMLIIGTIILIIVIIIITMIASSNL